MTQINNLLLLVQPTISANKHFLFVAIPLFIGAVALRIAGECITTSEYRPQVFKKISKYLFIVSFIFALLWYTELLIRMPLTEWFNLISK